MTAPGAEASDRDLIVADVGGTNGRFALASSCAEPSSMELGHIRSYRNAGLRDFDELLSLYLAELGGMTPKRACLGIAGPASGGKGRITNLGWSVDALRLCERFGFEEVVLVNDFAALAWMTPLLPAEATLALAQPSGAVPGPRSVIGPGTGFGVALVVGTGREHMAISTECGHMSYAPCTRLERELRDFLEPALGHVSVESLLSGAGLVRIHDFLIDHEGAGNAMADPAAISRAALDGSEPSCTRAVQLFLSILGSVAGDIALAHGATGGVYLGGGVLPRIASLIAGSDFLDRFVDKGPMREYLARIPVHLITAPHIALLGAAAMFRQESGRLQGRDGF